MNIAFAGFRHSHIMALYQKAMESATVKVIGAFEADAETRLQMEEQHGIQFRYPTYEALLCDPLVDAVAIGDYYAIRGERTIEALKHGKHVISDKPLCTSLAEEAEIRRLSEEKGLTVYLMLDLRFADFCYTAKQLLEQNAVGKITHILFQGQHPLMYGKRPAWYFEKGKYGGIINDIAIHGIDAVTYMTGLTVANTLAVRTKNAYATEEPHFLDSGTFLCELSQGADLMADVSYSSPDGMQYAMPTYWSFQVWGLDGMLSFARNVPTLTLYKKDANEPISITPHPIGKSLLDDFLDCVAGKQNTVITTAEMLEATRTTLQIQALADKT